MGFIPTVWAEEANVSTVDTTNQTAINRAIFNRVYDNLKADAALPMQQLTLKVALQFLGTDYTYYSLEIEPEQLQVFLDKTDCILFVEMSVAFALTIKGKAIVQAGDGEHYTVNPVPSLGDATPSYELLCHNIQQMRYRLGIVDGYASRIHYTSEWLLQNQTNGLMQEYTADLGEEIDQQFYVMSMHPHAYFQLAKDPCELGKVRMMEDRLTAAKPYYCISQKQLKRPEVMSQIQSGDIVTFVSRTPGVDLAHVAIAYEVDGTMHFIHASSRALKVIIEKTSLADYAKNGIRITRLL